jgi:Rrf2 family transcriptional regulator, nitric oxide-sensitive transcriptional repressor
MKLTAFTDYSLRVLMYMATDPGQRATIAQIARAYAISEHHLVKVVHFLGQQGWLKNVRGKGGGLELGMAPERIVVGQVVRATEGLAAVAECFEEDGGHCALSHSCRLRGVLREAVTAFESVLDRYTLADVVSNRHQLAQILFFEPGHKGTRKQQ